MINRLSLAVCASALLLVTACDKIKLPGGDRDVDIPSVDLPSTDDLHLPERNDTTDTVVTDPSTPDSGEPHISGPPSDVPEDVLNATQDGEPETDEEAALPLENLSLAMLNASRCHLEGDGVPTPTVTRVAGATNVAENTVSAQAVNAGTAMLANFPGIVKLEPRNMDTNGNVSSGHCGATRIAQNWFVTAAHCVDEDYQELRLIGEAENIRSPLARITTASVAICHNGYHGIANGYANDIALIRLNDDHIEAIGNVPIARYGKTELPLSPSVYEAADMAGWGLTRYGGQLSNTLLTTTLDVETIGPAMITVATRDGAGPCVGDSGGPLYVTEPDGQRTLVGVLSVVEQNKETGEFCSGTYNGRYTNLQGFEDWMQSVMRLCETNPETCQ